MADNTTLNPGSGGDVIRDIARTSGASLGAKTQVIALDLGGGEGFPENLLNTGQDSMAQSMPVALAWDQPPDSVLVDIKTLLQQLVGQPDVFATPFDRLAESIRSIFNEVLNQFQQPYAGTWTARNGNITNAQIVTPIVVAAPGGSAAHSYVPTNTITLNDGAPSVSGVLTVASTLVVSATIAAAGTFTGTTGPFTVTGTTGTGTKFTANCTLTNGSGITAVLSILTGGAYTANPTTITAEPVTAANLSAATLNVSMGVLSATLTTAGNVTAVPANPVAQTSSTGAGTGATFTLTYQGLSQTLMASNASRKAFFIQNPMTALGQNIAAAENIYVNYTLGSGVQDGVSIELGPGGAVPISPVISIEKITVNAQTLGHRYIAREM